MPAVKIMTLTCPGCGLVWRTKSRDKSTYCTRGCYIANGAGKHLKTGTLLDCANCGEGFYSRGSHIAKGAKYCSMDCYDAARRLVNRDCVLCGKNYTPKSKTQKFCSHACSKKGPANPNWSGGVTKRLVNDVAYKEWRKSVFASDNYLCVICGNGGSIEAHHKDAYHWNKERRLDPKNGVTLCVSCHREFHSTHGRKHCTEDDWKKFKETKNGV